MPAQPVVSILMPVRNEQAYLPAALRSLARQTLRVVGTGGRGRRIK